MSRKPGSKLSVDLPSRLKSFVSKLVSRGDFQSPDEVIHESLRRMHVDDQALLKLDRLHRKGMRSLATGVALDGEAAMRKHRARLMQKVARRKAS